MIKILIPLLLCFFLPLTAFAQHLNECDLLFVVNNEGNHITEVTQGDNNLPIDHVAIMHYIGGEHTGTPFVIEAIYEGVTITPLEEFIANNDSSVIVGRVNIPFNATTTSRNALSYVGRPYDFVYYNDDTAIYCSELVLKSFVDDNGTPIFQTVPMTFRDSSGNIPQYWIDFYSQYGKEVPEGEPGSNPAELSLRTTITLLAPITHFSR